MSAIITINVREKSDKTPFAHVRSEEPIIRIPKIGELPLVRPGSIIVLPSGRMFYVKGIGIDRHGMGPYYAGEDVEHPGDGKLELLHCYLEKFGYQEITPFGERTIELREAFK